MTDSSATPSGSGEKHTQLSVDLDPVAIAELAKSKSSDEAEKAAATSGNAKHQLSVDLSGMTWGEVQTSLGSMDFLSDAKVSLTPAQANNPLQADLHLDLLKMNWKKIGDLTLTTGLGGDLDYTDGKGVGGKLDLTQGVKFDKFEIDGEFDTDFSSSSPQLGGKLSFKYTF